MYINPLNQIKRKMKLLMKCFILGAVIVPLLAVSNSSTTATTKITKKTTPQATTKSSITTSSTTLSPDAQECAKHNGSCEECLKKSKCLYCKEDNLCKLYPSGDILPKSSLCPLSEARWGVCWLNFEALIISVSVIGGVIILTITFCCIYCCCCRKGSKKRYDKEDSRYEQQKMERKVKQDERRTERKGRLDEIRRKYGLVKDDAPYQRFDA